MAERRNMRSGDGDGRAMMSGREREEKRKRLGREEEGWGERGVRGREDVIVVRRVEVASTLREDG